jgi:hypothetical protein
MQLHNPENFNIKMNQRPGPVDPFSQFDQLPRMPYLEIDPNNSDLNKDERE